MDKKGQGLSVTTIILIILGVSVLIFLILGFTMGWKKILPWIKPGNNVQEVVSSCQMACSMNSVYDYCTKKRDLITESETFKDVTCEILSSDEKYSQYGIEKCPGLCPAV